MIKIVSLATKLTYTIEPRKGGENAMACPECSGQRKNAKAKSFSWNEGKQIGKCHHCEANFVLYREMERQKEYIAPLWKNKTLLAPNLVKWFEGRMIKQDTLVLMRIYSDNEFIPQIGKETSVVCFPYFQDEKLVNIKYRDGAKNFKLHSGAQLILYNVNGLKGQKEAIICEGEIDALSYITCGILNAVSVPNGANKNLQYLDDCIELFDAMETIYIASDNDVKGIELREELLRRFGSERCKIVNYKDCKDANEYLIKYGGPALRETITDAIEIPVTGIVNLSNHYDDIYSLFVNGMEKGLGIGAQFDTAVTWELGRLLTVTGIPGHGKSEFVDFLNVKLNIIHGWKIAYFSPENWPVKYHYAKLVSKIVGKEFDAKYINTAVFEKSFEYVRENFFFINPEEDMTIENILTKAKFLVRKRGIKVLVIDPYNKLEHNTTLGQSETNYISKFLDKLTMFARVNNVLVVLVAHPTKMKKDLTGNFEVPSLYDINGSANFYNKTDYGISVYRDRNENQTYIHVLKVKFKHLGDGGVIQTSYNFKNGRYEAANTEFSQWVFDNYLDEEIKPEPEKPYQDEFFNAVDKFENEVPF